MATVQPGDGLRVLCLNGPPLAAAALSELFFLRQIGHRWAFNEDDEDVLNEGYHVRVSDMFDVIGGCGIGGLYAILFARVNMTIGQVIEFHTTLQGKLLAADCWARKEQMECMKVLDDILDEMVSNSDVGFDLGSPFFSKDCKKCFVLVLNEVRASSKSLRSLRSYRVRAGPSPRCTVRQALHASLADCEHLAAVFIEDELFTGTSTHFSNPARILLKELAAAFPALHLACFVDLGADYTRPRNNSHRIGQDLMSQFRNLGCFFRLSVKSELNAESPVKSLVMGYLLEDDVSVIVDGIVDALHRRKPVVTLLRLGNLSGEDGKNELRRDVSNLLNEEEIKRALKKIHPSYDFLPIHEHGCLEGTRTDVLDYIEDWVEDVDAPNVFWLEGYPGTGKTAISVTLKQRLAEASRLGASCFFRREDAAHHTLDTLLRSLASQLAGNHNSFRDVIVQAVNSGDVKLESAPSSLFDKLVYNPLTAACANVNDSILVVVLDAMDEFGRTDEDRLRLVKILLPRWTHLSSRCKLFITSRSQRDLPCHLDRPAHRIRRLEIGDAASTETISDIQRFFEYTFENIQNSLRSSTPLVTDSELKTLVTASSGLFIWASTVIQMVKQKTLRKAAKRFLQGLCTQHAAVESRRMQPLYRLYRTVLNPLLGSEESQGDQPSEELLAKQTFFSALVCAKTPLSASALSSFCKVDEDDIQDIAQKLTPVIDSTHGLRFVHKSFVDYIISTDFPFPLDLDTVELAFTHACFEIMRAQLRFNMGNMPSSYMLNADMPKLCEALSEELRYAARFWVAHLKRVQKWDKGKMMSLAQPIDGFLNHRFLYWLEAVSILGCIREATDGFSTLRAAGFGKAVSDFSQDALAFLHQFALPITQSYPHIYVSAVPSAPKSSLVRLRYLDRAHVLRIISHGNESWPAQLAVIYGHTSLVSSVAFSPDGFRILSGSHDSTVRIWDAATRQSVGEPLQGHNGWVDCVSFSPDGTQIASGSRDNTIRIWNAATCQTSREPLRGHEGAVLSVLFSPDSSQIVSGSSDTTLRLWDAATQQPIGEPLRGHSDLVRSAAFSPDGSQIISGSSDNTVRIWDAATHLPLGEPLRGHDDEVWSVAFSPDSSQIVSGSHDRTIQIWDAVTHQHVRTLEGHGSLVTSVLFSPDGAQIVSGLYDGTIRIWDAATHEPLGEPLQGHESAAWSVMFSPDSSQIVSGSMDKSVRIWDATTFQRSGGPLRGHNSQVNCVSFSPDGSQIISGSQDRTVRIWNGATLQPVGEPLRGHEDAVYSIAFSPNGSQIVSGSSDTTLRLWDAATHQPIGGPLRGHDSTVRSVAFSPDSSQIVSGSDDNSIRVWDAATRQIIGEPLRGHEDPVWSVAFSPSCSHIISGSADTTIRIWSATTHQLVGEPLQSYDGAVTSIALSPDGSQMVSGLYDHIIRIWDVATCLPVGEPLLGHKDWAASVMFSPDGSQIVSGSIDKTMQIWDAFNCEPVGEPFRGHDGPVTSAVFSPNGSWIATGSDDNTIRIWNTATHQPIKNSLHGRDAVNTVAFSPDGAQIVSGSQDNTIQIWDVVTRKPVGELLRGHGSSVRSVTFSPNGSQIASGSDDNTIRLWDAVTHQPVGEPLQGHNDAVSSVAFSPNGSQIVSGSWDNTVRIWSAATLLPVGEPLRGHNNGIWSVTFSPNGSQIASGSIDTMVRLWDAGTRQPIGEPLQGHDGAINSVAFSPDGSQIVSGSSDSTIRIWDTTAHQAVGEPLRGHTDRVNSVIFSPDGSQFVSGSDDETILIWATTTHQLVGGFSRGHTSCISAVVFSPDGSQIASGSFDQTIRIWDATPYRIVRDFLRIKKTIVMPPSAHSSSSEYFLLEDGWLIDQYHRRVIWIPHHLHTFLPTPGLAGIIGRQEMIVMDTLAMHVGSEWDSSFTPS